MSHRLDAIAAFLNTHLRSAAIELVDWRGRSRRVGPDGASLAGTIELCAPQAVALMADNPGLNVGRTYVDGQWRVIRGDLVDIIATLKQDISPRALSWAQKAAYAAHRVAQLIGELNTPRRSLENVEHHYGLGNEFYMLWLDEELFYSCGYFRKDDDTLETAQQNKARHIATKLNLSPGCRVLDIGCGWGGMALYLAQYFDVHVTGISLEKQQIEFASKRARDRGLNNQTRFELCDYRGVSGTYDRIVSIGMLEHVGQPHLAKFFATVGDLLNPEGVALIHTIGAVRDNNATNPWVERYIFPGGHIPSLTQIAAAAAKADVVVCDIEVLRLHYALTLNLWRGRFHAAHAKIVSMFGERFFRMWDFYLAVSEASFRAGVNVVYQCQVAKTISALPLTRDYLYGDAGLLGPSGFAGGIMPR